MRASNSRFFRNSPKQYACETGDDGEFTFKQMPADMGIVAEIAAPGFGVFRCELESVQTGHAAS